MCEPSNGRELLVDGVCSQTAPFQVHAVSNDYDAIEGQSGFGAVPGDELVDSILVHAARGWRAEAVEDGQFAMIQIRQPKHSATVIRFDPLFAHSDGLPCRSTCDYGGRLDVARRWASSGVRGVLSAMACSRQLIAFRAILL